MPASGFGGSGLYCDHAPFCHRYVDIVLVGAILAGFLKSAFFMAGFWEVDILYGRLPGVGHPVVIPGGGC